MSVDVVANVVQIASVVTAFLLSAYGVWRRIDKRQQDSEVKQALLMQKIDYITNQFGPNGGGLRQAVNEMSQKIDRIDARVNTIAEDLSEVSGRFDQHIIESR